ncbi:MAG TPA: ABC transporter ATP-binding protein [Chloroflexota bacterium]|nr:ABC transporter ATP-binding protein [Chloroflexota bacterium]
MPQIQLERVSKRFGQSVLAVDDLSLVFPSGHFVCLLGPSGCGKSTTLRMVAGLELPTSGEIRMDGRVLSSGSSGRFVPPEKRGMGLVFQSYALWPHMTVAQNISFGLEMRGWKPDQRRQRVRELQELLRIGGLEERYPLQLSGGQQQRVALARMLAVNPDVLLLDEPLSNLDARLRLEMRAELKRLHEQLGNTIIFVTHDQLEAMTIATEIAVMHEGRLQQFAPPLEVYRQPANLFVAEFVGSPSMNLFSLDEAADASLARSMLASLGLESDRHTRVKTIGLRPEAIRIMVGETYQQDVAWSSPATVETILPTGAEWIVRLQVCESVAFARMVEEPCFGSQASVAIAVDPADVHLFDLEGVRLASATPGAGARLAG